MGIIVIVQNILLTIARTSRISGHATGLLLGLLLYRLYWSIDSYILNIFYKRGLVLTNNSSLLKTKSGLKKNDIIFTSTIEKKDILKKKKYSSNNKLNIIYIGRISPEKDIQTLIKALTAISF